MRTKMGDCEHSRNDHFRSPAVRGRNTTQQFCDIANVATIRAGWITRLSGKRAHPSNFPFANAVYGPTNQVSLLIPLPTGVGAKIALATTMPAAMGIRHRRAKPSRVFAAGLLTGREDARMEAAIITTTEAYADLVKVKPFWH